jgi:hypothetical protein
LLRNAYGSPILGRIFNLPTLRWGDGVVTDAADHIGYAIT